VKINTYLIKSKVDLIKKAQADFKEIYGLECSPFSRKIYFYFFVHDNKKYVHKESLRFVYSNADTYTTVRDPEICDLNKQITPVDIVPFLESYTGTLIPDRLEINNKFLVYEYFEGSPVDYVTADEFYKLKAEHYKTDLTPFYNSMTFNLVRSNDNIKLVDLKHFEPRDNKPFFIYLYNEEFRLNTLYIEHSTELGSIIDYLSVDYPADAATIIEL
jgi:hypothetical protein